VKLLLLTFIASFIALPVNGNIFIPPSLRQSVLNQSNILVAQGILNGGGIPYSGNMAISISAPKGWDFDASSGSEQGMLAVMYPHGSSWAESETAIYVGASTLKNNETLDSYIARDIERNKKTSPSMLVISENPIRLKGNSTAQIRIFAIDRGRYEAIAYIVGENPNLMLVVLTCSKKASFDQYISGFRKVVAESSILKVKTE
jgi:hypothetical protein